MGEVDVRAWVAWAVEMRTNYETYAPRMSTTVKRKPLDNLHVCHLDHP